MVPESPPTYPIHVSVRWLPRACWIATICQLLAHLAMWTYHYRVHEVPDYLSELLDVENEQSLENAYSSFALAMAGWLTIAMATHHLAAFPAEYRARRLASLRAAGISVLCAAFPEKCRRVRIGDVEGVDHIAAAAGCGIQISLGDRAAAVARLIDG